MTYKYKSIPHDFYKNVDPEVAADALFEIERKHGDLTPEIIVGEAKKKRHPLHKCFEWDDTKAAHKFRLSQASSIMRVLVTVTDDNEDDEPVRVFVNVYDAGHKSYRQLNDVLSDDALREQLFNRLLSDISSLERKYKKYTALSGFFAHVDKAKDQLRLQSASANG